MNKKFLAVCMKVVFCSKLKINKPLCKDGGGFFPIFLPKGTKGGGPPSPLALVRDCFAKV